MKSIRHIFLVIRHRLRTFKYISDRQMYKRNVSKMKCGNCGHAGGSFQFYKEAKYVESVMLTGASKTQDGILISRNCPKCKSSNTSIIKFDFMECTDLHLYFLYKYDSVKMANRMYKIHMIRQEIQCYFYLYKLNRFWYWAAAFSIANAALFFTLILKHQFVVSVFSIFNIFIVLFYLELERIKWYKNWEAGDDCLMNNHILHFRQFRR